MTKKATSKGLLESGSPNPCPPSYYFVVKVNIDGDWYCKCSDGVNIVLVACPPPA